ncbi:MAG: ABC transporter ATP-binding protein [Spirochaetaceae bacterium]|jgi:ABC-type nitrate/sulfonate/bicarbonate transport system ATPase subunit|nr:ABC transporter ATP-binding protein [Spirochaetaceae bacterium]
MDGPAAKATETKGFLSIDRVNKAFRHSGGDLVPVLNDVSLSCRPGEFVVLIGPSGCGKSTLLRLVAGLIKADSGLISLDGESVVETGYERGLVFQDPTLFPWKTVYENVAYGLRVRGVYRAEKDCIAKFINMVGLSGFEKALPHELSGGMAQRTALARALVNKPRVLLLDESLGALDAFTRINMQDEILKIWESRKMTTVMVTHDVDEAIYMADRIVVMSARPAVIEVVLEVGIARPRLRDAAGFLELRAKILRLLHMAGNRQGHDDVCKQFYQEETV